VWAANWFNLLFAPDGRRLAMEIREASSDVWVYDWERDTLSRLTSDPIRATKPVWTPDGRRIVFSSPRADKVTPNLYWQLVAGGEAQRLTDSSYHQEAASWDPSGRYLAFEQMTPSPMNIDVMILPVEGDEATGWKIGKPTVFLNSPFIEAEPMFSPDGRWLAYCSNESGQLEVYVRPFRGPGGKVRVSKGGGNLPTWSRTKHELFYGADGQIMVVPFTVNGNVFRPETARVWSVGRYQTRGPNRMFDLHPDGHRFALAPDVQLASAVGQERAVFVFNFLDELHRIAPAVKR
jgi:Tol biopolymer transport system component